MKVIRVCIKFQCRRHDELFKAGANEWNTIFKKMIERIQ